MCAVIKQGILGGLSGSVGSVTGSSWKGIAVLKAKPLSVANPKTAKQVAQRDKMTWLVAFFKLILSNVVKPLNDRFASKMSGFNLVVQQSMGAFDIAGVIDDFTKIFITPSSKGEQVVTISDPDEGTASVSFNWVSTAGIGTQLASDKCYAVIYNETQDRVYSLAGTVIRSTNTGSIVVPADFNVEDDILHLYVAFLKSDGTIAYKQSYSTGLVQAV